VTLRRRWLLLLIPLALTAMGIGVLVTGGHGASTGANGIWPPARSAYIMTVGCDQIILIQKSGSESGSRVMLGVVGVPPDYLPGPVPVRQGSWRYWRKYGLVVRAGSPTVLVSVPKAWQDRVAVTWGNNLPAVNALRLASCSGPAGAWNVYAGGFFLRSHSACVPLVFRAGQRSATVRFGIGRRCSRAT
jgi:hypothetical protein